MAVNVGVYRRLPRLTPRIPRNTAWRQPGPQAGILPSAVPFVYQGLNRLYSGTGYAISAIPGVNAVIGDTFIVQNQTALYSWPATVNDDSSLIIYNGGNTARDSLQYWIYRRLTGTIDGPGTIWFNEVAPTWFAVPAQTETISVLMTPFAFANYCTSIFGDQLTFAVTSGTVPPGLTMNPGGVVSGTPTTPGVYTFIVSATDYTGTTVAGPPIQFTISSGNVVVPCLPPSTQQAGYGGDKWGASGGSATPVNANVPVIQSLGQGTQKGNVINTLPSSSVIGDMSTGALPAGNSVCSIPTNPQVGS